MIERPKNATQYCWLFAAACVYDKTFLEGGKVTTQQLKLFMHAIQEQVYPPASLVEQIFTRPFLTIEDKGWPLDITYMGWYWTGPHRSSRTERTPVDYNMVKEVGEGDTVYVFDDKADIYKKKNIHGYKLEKGDFVYTHGDIIAIPTQWSF